MTEIKTISSERIRVLGMIAVLKTEVRDYDSIAKSLGEEPLGAFLDLDPTPAPAVVVAPVTKAEGIVPGSLNPDGSVLLEGWQRAVAESAESADKWHQLWAAQTNRTDRFMIADALQLPGLTPRQQLNIAKNLERAGLRSGLFGFDVNDTAFDKRASGAPAREITANDSGLGQDGDAIPGVSSFGTQAVAREAYQYAIRARDAWIEGQPLRVSERTGIYYGQNKR